MSQLMIEKFHCFKCDGPCNVQGKWIENEKMLACTACGQRNFEAEVLNKRDLDEEMAERIRTQKAAIRAKAKEEREKEKIEAKRQAWLGLSGKAQHEQVD